MLSTVFERGYLRPEHRRLDDLQSSGRARHACEGITGAGREDIYDLVADWVDLAGNPRASVLHLDAAGRETWIDFAVPGAVVTSANSIYEDRVIGVYTGANGVTNGYVVTIPGSTIRSENYGTLVINAKTHPALWPAPTS
jgi:hypothetical protein